MDDHADDLLRRALIDQDAAAAVALRVGGLPLCDALTIVFHGRRDLGTIQTYITHGQRGAGSAVGPDELLRVPCDLDLASARDRDEAEELYAEQAGALRDALEAADTVLAVWQEPFEDLAGSRVAVDRRLELDVRLPAHRLLPAALVAPEKQIVVTAVCSARPLAQGRPPMGIVCAQQDVARGYPPPPPRARGPPRRWGSSARSRMWRASTRCPTTPSAASRTSSSRPRSTRAARASGSPSRRPRSSVSSSSRATTSTRPGSRSASFSRPCAASRSSPPSPSGRSSSSASRSCSPGR